MARALNRVASLPSRSTLTLVLLLLAIPSLAASSFSTATPASVILISVDTLRADHLGCYGYKALTTPNIDSLARGGTIFSEVNSQIPITLPSHVSLFTSMYPFMTGIEENGEVVPSGATTLATVLKAHGYRTAAFIGGYFLARRFGFDQGFDVYDSPFDSRRFERALDLKRPAAEVTKSAEAWISANSSHPFFAFVHLFDLHQPYNPPARFERLAPKSEYGAELAYVDDVLGGFFRFLSEKGITRRCLLVLLSDHGESLGEHGEHTHGYFIYQSTLHVPLIIHWPAEGRGFSPAAQTPSVRFFEARFSAGLEESVWELVYDAYLRCTPASAGVTALDLEVLFGCSHSRESGNPRVFTQTLEAPPLFSRSPKPGIGGTTASAILPSRVDSPAGLIDVAPTILQTLGIAQPPSFAGRSLIPLFNGEVSSAREVYSESTYAHDKFGWAALRGVRIGTYQYIQAPKPELYNLVKDRAEVHNLYSSHEALAQSYSDRLDALRAQYHVQTAAAKRVSPEVLERLRSLGYLAVASPKADSSSGADPKDHVAEYNQYLEGMRFAQTGKASQGAAIFERITHEDPENTAAHFELATCDMSLRRYQDAVTELKVVLAALPHDVEAAETLGTLWLQLGQEDSAEKEFRAVLSFAPGDFTAEYGLGTIAARERRFDEAIKYFRAALAARPESAGTHYNLGLALETVGRNQEARQEFREALKDDPDFVAAQTAIDRLESH